MEIFQENNDGAAGPGHENDELEWGKQNIPDEPHVFFADRVTALHDIPKTPDPGMPLKRPRRKTGQEKPDKDRDAAVHRALAQEIQERQEELADALLALINDLQYRVDRLENLRRIPVKNPPVARPEEKR